jgi:hypothetical protein
MITALDLYISTQGSAASVGRRPYARVDRSPPAENKDCEYLTETGEAFVYAAMIRLIR